MSSIKKKCKTCNIEFVPNIKANRAILCKECYGKKVTQYYHRKKEKVMCICGKSVYNLYFLRHLQSKLHQRWLIKKMFFYNFLTLNKTT